MKHNHAKNCQHIAVSQSEVGDVAICTDCGVVHVALQYVSLRFEASAFRELTQMLAMAQMKIDHLAHAEHMRHMQAADTSGLH